jgi:hypothetical protein
LIEVETYVLHVANCSRYVAGFEVSMLMYGPTLGDVSEEERGSIAAAIENVFVDSRAALRDIIVNIY